MVILSHILGFPRIGLHRELKKAQEDYWSGKINQQRLLKTGYELRTRHWKQQKEAGLDFISVGDFAWYDHVLTTSLMLDNISSRYRNSNNINDIDTLFRVARGRAPTGKLTAAAEMTKWFNTNYHYIVPEFTLKHEFKLGWKQLLEEVDEALTLGYRIKPILLGPVSYLWLGKVKGDHFDRLLLLPKILNIYNIILDELAKRDIDWIQIDEPALVLELPVKWQDAYQIAYKNIQGQIKILLTTYFDSIEHNLDMISNLPVQGLHVDLVSGNDNLEKLHRQLPIRWVLSAGIINGRNIWRANLDSWFKRLYPISDKRELWLGSSCSLLHSPIDLEVETQLNQEIKCWFAFALQKCVELSMLCAALNDPNHRSQEILFKYSAPINNRQYSNITNNIQVKQRLKKITPSDSKRNLQYSLRNKLQRKKLKLPIWPTTTIGSFPQTNEIRSIRLEFKRGRIDKDNYRENINKYIEQAIKEQERLGLDVLVHGEAERNDMVEYFGEHLDGFALTKNGWVQSYGSRCVKPPIIIGDVSRSKTITVEWICYAQSLTNKTVKGMLTGPITILYWSFPREDVSNKIIAQQIALALRDEVKDLESSGINIIQIDEPALREGLPLKRSAWKDYLSWSIEAFRLSSSVVKDSTQIHTHMCYGEFQDIINSIVNLDADVITIETSRSNMELLETFKKFSYPNEIGLGVYDVHSPNIPNEEWIINLLLKAAQFIPIERLWVNPDCGLKTRSWLETTQSLTNMVSAAKRLRKKYV